MVALVAGLIFTKQNYGSGKHAMDQSLLPVMKTYYPRLLIDPSGTCLVAGKRCVGDTPATRHANFFFCRYARTSTNANSLRMGVATSCGSVKTLWVPSCVVPVLQAMWRMVPWAANSLTPVPLGYTTARNWSIAITMQWENIIAT